MEVLASGTVGSIYSNIRNVSLSKPLLLLSYTFSSFLGRWAGKMSISSPRYIFPQLRTLWKTDLFLSQEKRVLFSSGFSTDPRTGWL